MRTPATCTLPSGDGFHESVPLDLIASDERIMLCYGWDGHALPIDHGFPLRIWIPDRFGMKQPKWITGIEVTEELKLGYWVTRGWDSVAQVQATSVIDTVAEDAAYVSEGRQFVPIGGIAFAGSRGVSRVEVPCGSRPLAGGKPEVSVIRNDLGGVAVRLAVRCWQSRVRGQVRGRRRNAAD